MTLLDTNILIEILKGNKVTIDKVHAMTDHVSISAVSVMELYYGAFDKAEVKKLEKFIALFEIIHLSKEISTKSIKLIQTYAKSHNLDIPDSLIAATSMIHNCKLLTYNIKDFKFIEGLELV